jgi:hypothetical protein
VKVIIVIEESNLDGIQVRFRTSENPAMHVMESSEIASTEDAYQYAQVFKRGMEVVGYVAVIAVDEDLYDNATLGDAGDCPKYLKQMRRDNFDYVWEALTA